MDVILKNILHSLVRLLDSTHYNFPNEALVIFDKWFTVKAISLRRSNLLRSIEESYLKFIGMEQLPNGLLVVRPLQTSQVRVKDSESVDSLSLPPFS
ncbi:hypothetical protein FQR65_LT09895 [Abscondita terminalis]|nr:hypothetical protein FQR65_LT09895 [Abscondita terminalis]